MDAITGTVMECGDLEEGLCGVVVKVEREAAKAAAAAWLYRDVEIVPVGTSRRMALLVKAIELQRTALRQRDAVERRVPIGMMVSRAKAKELLGISSETLGRMLRDGRLQGVKVGRQWRIPLETIREITAGRGGGIADHA